MILLQLMLPSQQTVHQVDRHHPLGYGNILNSL